MTDQPTIAALALARPTFDVPFAEDMADRAFKALTEAGYAHVGPQSLLMDGPAVEAALTDLAEKGADRLLLLQVTFTDASMTVSLAKTLGLPVAIWAFPEPRTGGRLRLNSFCGLNLAAHALGRAGIRYGSLFAAPDAPGLAAALADLFAGTAPPRAAEPDAAHPSAADAETADRILVKLSGARIGLIGRHPDGFDTCRYDPDALEGLTGTRVERIALDTVFDRARAADDSVITETHKSVSTHLSGVDAVDQTELDRSLRVHDALKGLATDHKLSAFAVRCWPEMFTEYGCAACGPMAMMNGAKVPSACEADVYGAVTALILQELSGEPSLLVDVVDMDDDTETGVFWHCGLAPLSMASPKTPPAADIHSNRRMPLLHAFALKPGRITLARLSQAKNETKLVVGGAEMIDAPMSFSGTSGVVRFDAPIGEVRARLLAEGLEHHVAFTYGDHRGALTALAEKLDLPVLVLS